MNKRIVAGMLFTTVVCMMLGAAASQLIKKM